MLHIPCFFYIIYPGNIAIYTELFAFFFFSIPITFIAGMCHNLFNQFSIGGHLNFQSFAIKHWSIWNWFSIWDDGWIQIIFFSRWLHSLPLLGHLLKSSLLHSAFCSNDLSIHAPVAGLFLNQETSTHVWDRVSHFVWITRNLRANISGHVKQRYSTMWYAFSVG